MRVLAFFLLIVATGCATHRDTMESRKHISYSLSLIQQDWAMLWSDPWSGRSKDLPDSGTAIAAKMSQF